MKYKKCLLLLLIIAINQSTFAEVMNCQSSYENQPFNRAVIDPTEPEQKYGHVECVYDHDVYYRLPENQIYLGIGAHWVPDYEEGGFWYCSVTNTGSRAETCSFELIQTKQ